MNNQENNFNNNENNEESFLKVSLVNQSVFIRKSKVCPLRDIPLSEINYTNLKLLNKFLTERGKIIASRISNVEIKKQRAIAKAIKIARQLGLISPIAKESN